MKHPATEYIIYCAAALMIVFVGLLTPQFGFTTTDDTSLLPRYLMKYNADNDPSVLGANSETFSGSCPEDKPIVGWLSYEGDKLLPTKLPPGEKPTVCFESYEAAYQEGFVNADYK